MFVLNRGQWFSAGTGLRQSWCSEQWEQPFNLEDSAARVATRNALQEAHPWGGLYWYEDRCRWEIVADAVHLLWIVMREYEPHCWPPLFNIGHREFWRSPNSFIGILVGFGFDPWCQTCAFKEIQHNLEYDLATSKRPSNPSCLATRFQRYSCLFGKLTPKMSSEILAEPMTHCTCAKALRQQLGLCVWSRRTDRDLGMAVLFHKS